MQEFTPPSERDAWYIDTNQFVEGPDQYVQDGRDENGWRLYLVEDLPAKRHVYALCRYNWDTNREDEIVRIGTAQVNGLLDRDAVNDQFESVDATPLSDGQWQLLKRAYDDRLQTVLDVCLIEKQFDIVSDRMYFEGESWPKRLVADLEDLEERYKRHKELAHDDDSIVEPDDDLLALEPLTDDQYDALDTIAGAVERPDADKVTHLRHAQWAGQLEFDDLSPTELRTIELVHQGLFRNHAAAARVQALLEEGLSQKEIAEKLGKDPSTISQQVRRADDLLRRAQWHTKHVPPADICN